jgi:hypothetical protein
MDADTTVIVSYPFSLAVDVKCSLHAPTVVFGSDLSSEYRRFLVKLQV